MSCSLLAKRVTPLTLLLLGLIFPIVAAFLLPVSPVSAAITTTFYPTDDGYLQDDSDNYQDCQGVQPYPYDNVSVEYSSTTLRIGQWKVGVDYAVWRAGLVFDTSSLPSNILISSAYVELYGQYDGSNSDFSYYIVEAGDIHSPLVLADYNVIYYKTAALSGAASTSDFATDDNNTLWLNAEGIDAIQPGSYTALALRSDEDVTASPPTGLEYIEFHSKESISAYRPRLVITYLPADLATPDDFELEAPQVYINYLTPTEGDQLFIFRTVVNYNNEDEVAGKNPSDYFQVQLITSENATVATVPLRRWGMAPLSIYLAAGNVIELGASHTIKITGTSLFTVPPVYTYTLTVNDWKGIARNPLTMDAWLEATTDRLENFDSKTYWASTDQGKKINDVGKAIFEEGISRISYVRPDMFVTPSYTTVNPRDSTFDSTWSNWGTPFANAFDDLADVLGVESVLLSTIFFIVLAAAAYYVVSRNTNIQGLALLVAAFVCVPALLFGVPPAIVAIIGLAGLLMFAMTWLRSA